MFPRAHPPTHAAHPLIRQDEIFFKTTLQGATPKGMSVDEFFVTMPNVPFVDLSKGDYDLVAQLETTKVLYVIYQSTGLDYGGSIPILVGLFKEVRVRVGAPDVARRGETRRDQTRSAWGVEGTRWE
jgi:hypothetical protein